MVSMRFELEVKHGLGGIRSAVDNDAFVSKLDCYINICFVLKCMNGSENDCFMGGEMEMEICFLAEVISTSK